MIACGVEPEYLVLVDPDSLEPIDALTTGTAGALIAVAARIGAVRLIDNEILSPQPSPPRPGEAIATCSA
jgi:pantoate--beta-alanine ligase